MRFIITLLALLTAGVAHAQQPAADASIASACGISHTGNDWDSNRRNGLARGTLQVAVWYDGRAAQPELAIQLAAPTGQKGFIRVGATRPGGPIDVFGKEIETRQYRIGNCRLTGLFHVAGVVPNGAIDGLAFGIFARYTDNTYRVLRSVGQPSSRADFVGAWPTGMNTSLFAQRTADIKNGFGREQSWAALYGAQYLANGKHQIPVK